MGAVIDCKTGIVYWLPFTTCCWGTDVKDDFKAVDFRLNSKLIVFTGARNEQEGDVKKYYYVFENNSFKEIQ